MKNLEIIEKVKRFEKLKKEVFSTEVAKKVCRMPYRRFSDWDRKNILPHYKRETIENWRTFSFYDLLIIKIVSLLRDVGIPTHKIKKIFDWLNTKDEIESAVEQASSNNVYVVTNLSDAHYTIGGNDFRDIMESEGNLMLTFKLNPILNELLKDLKI
jgi:DNA-binding transcriptional MerR regulator